MTSKSTYNRATIQRYDQRLADKKWCKMFIVVPVKDKESVKSFTNTLRVRDTWDIRAKAECKALGRPTRFYYHARNFAGKDVFLDSGEKTANNGWGLFPSYAALDTAWGELTGQQKEAITNEAL